MTAPLSRRTRHGRVLAGAFAVLGLLLPAACTSGDAKTTAATDSPRHTPTPSATGSSTPAPRPATARNPYTGVGGVPTTPVVAVKIDDTAPGRPQVNIDKADIVYIEAVEGGLTRLAAIFGTSKPTVGYVRSTRPSDPELLLQYGRITEAYSGGARVSLAIRQRSGLTGWSNDAGAGYYVRNSRSESDYINLTLNLAEVAKHVKTAKPRSIGWTFASSLAGLPQRKGGYVRTTVTGSYSNGTPVEFRYDTALGTYVRYIDGVAQHAADGKPVTATNVVVQSCAVESYPADRDVMGNPAQFTHSIGSGPVSVFRQGKRIDGTWSRGSTSSGTTLRLSNGKALPLAPGNTWVVLIRKGIAVTSP